MKLYKLDPIHADPRYCSFDSRLPYCPQLQTGCEPARPRMQELGHDAAPLPLDEDSGGLIVGDYVTNLDGYLALHRTCAESILREFQVGPHEIVPTELRNEKGRLHSADVVIVNPLDSWECLDRAHASMTGEGDWAFVLALSPWRLFRAAIPRDRDIFRVKGMPGDYIFSERLVQFIVANGLRNFVFEEATLV